MQCIWINANEAEIPSVDLLGDRGGLPHRLRSPIPTRRINHLSKNVKTRFKQSR